MKIPLVSAVNILTAVVLNRETSMIVWEQGEGLVEEEMIERVLKIEDAYGLKADLERKHPELRGKLDVLPVTGGVTFVESAARMSAVLRDRMTRPFTG